ncbi:MAG: hypothetical protein ACT4OM_04725 [Actinomycetota bacterium]
MILEMAVAIASVAFVVLVVRDFRAGLAEDRLWSDPAQDDPESFKNRAVRASLAYDELPAHQAEAIALARFAGLAPVAVPGPAPVSLPRAS